MTAAMLAVSFLGVGALGYLLRMLHEHTRPDRHGGMIDLRTVPAVADEWPFPAVPYDHAHEHPLGDAISQAGHYDRSADERSEGNGGSEPGAKDMRGAGMQQEATGARPEDVGVLHSSGFGLLHDASPPRDVGDSHPLVLVDDDPGVRTAVELYAAMKPGKASEL